MNRENDEKLLASFQLVSTDKSDDKIRELLSDWLDEPALLEVQISMTSEVCLSEADRALWERADACLFLFLVALAHLFDQRHSRRLAGNL